MSSVEALNFTACNDYLITTRKSTATGNVIKLLYFFYKFEIKIIILFELRRIFRG